MTALEMKRASKYTRCSLETFRESVMLAAVATPDSMHETIVVLICITIAFVLIGFGYVMALRSEIYRHLQLRFDAKKRPQAEEAARGEKLIESASAGILSAQMSSLAIATANVLSKLEIIAPILNEIQRISAEASTSSKSLQGLQVETAKVAGETRKLGEGLLAANTRLAEFESKVENRFSAWFQMNSSWLATPYPSRFKFLLRDKANYLLLSRGASVAVEIVCERCDKVPHGAKAYEVKDAKLYFSERNITLLAEAGIASAIFALGSLPLVVVAHHAHLPLVAKAIAKVSQSGEVAKVITEAAPMLGAEILTSRWKSDSEARRFAEFVPELSGILDSKSLQVVTVGGNSHHHLGRLIGQIDAAKIKEQQPFGGLVRVLLEAKNEHAPCYKWVCRKCWEEIRGAPQLPSV